MSIYEDNYTIDDYSLEHEILLRVLGIDINIPEYMLALLKGVTLEDIKKLKPKVIPSHNHNPSTEALETVSHQNLSPDDSEKLRYLRVLTAEICGFIEDIAMSQVIVSRNSTNNSHREAVRIKLHGGDIIETDDFNDCLFFLQNRQPLAFALYRIFADICNPENPLYDNPLGKVLEAKFGASSYCENKDLDSIVRSTTVRFNKSITTTNMTNQMAISLLVSYVLREIVIEHLPKTWVAIKINESHVDYIISSKKDIGISLTGVHDENTEYRHVCYHDLNASWSPVDCAAISVVSHGMFSIDILSIILAHRFYLSNVVISSWQDLKNKAAYDAYNS